MDVAEQVAGNGFVIVESDLAPVSDFTAAADALARLTERVDELERKESERAHKETERAEKEKAAAAQQLQALLANPDVQRAMIADMLKGM